MALGRLGEGATIAAASAEMSSLVRRLRQRLADRRDQESSRYRRSPVARGSARRSRSVVMILFTVGEHSCCSSSPAASRT